MERLGVGNWIRLAGLFAAAFPATVAAGDLDLREANVTGETVTASGSDHRFAVALHHDDDGEAG
ncbi:hypothetical protein [Thiohalorhabdus sp.]|uniref:hypothetical protein n=1 Tax=Thiohalorhabdus sp. TaxID=3094134 RepID=UPI002FC301DD